MSESSGKPSEQMLCCENLAVRTAAALLCAFQVLPGVQRVRSGKKTGLSSNNVKDSVYHYSLLQAVGV